MSTSIASDAPLRSPVAEAPHAAAHVAPSATVEPTEGASLSDPPRYTSPVVKVDSGTGLALLVVRDGDTGKEVEQYPSRHVVEEYKRNIPTAVDRPQSASKPAAAEDVKAPPAPVAAAPSAPAAPAAPAPAPSGGSVKV